MSITAMGPKFQGLGLYVTPDSNRVSWAAFSSKGNAIGRDEIQLTVHNIQNGLSLEEMAHPDFPLQITYSLGHAPAVGALADMLDNPATRATEESRAAAVKALEAVQSLPIDAQGLTGRSWRNITPQNALKWMRSGLTQTIETAKTQALTHHANVYLQGPHGERLVGNLEDGELTRAMRESRFYEAKKTWPEIYVDPAKETLFKLNHQEGSPISQWWRHLRTLRPTIKPLTEEIKAWPQTEVRSASLSLKG